MSASQARQGSRWERVEVSRRVRAAQGREVTRPRARDTSPVRGAARARSLATSPATQPRSLDTRASAFFSAPFVPFFAFLAASPKVV